MLKEFRKFLFETNALALAVGVIIGGAVGKVVSSLVSDVIMPVIGLAIPGGVWRNVQIVLTRNPDGTPANAIQAGSFLGTLVDFLIVAWCVFAITKVMLKPAQAKAAAPTKACPQCLETVSLEAKRCKFCTSPL